MRLFFISLIIATILLLPDLAAQLDWAQPPKLLHFLGNGLAYMCVFFHELGHAAINWLYGYPALPSFDFEHGGGMTYGFSRVRLLLGGVWMAMGAGVIWLWQGGYHTALAGFIVFISLYFATAFNDGHQVIISYMGHGGEILVGGFCLIRAGLNMTDSKYGAVERWLSMVFGFYTIGRNIIMSGGLALSDISRMAYAQQKGGHMFGDFDRIADMLGLPLQAIGWFSITFTLMITCTALIVIGYGLSQAAPLQKDESFQNVRPARRQRKASKIKTWDDQ